VRQSTRLISKLSIATNIQIMVNSIVFFGGIVRKYNGKYM
jgi:hypothetical protein